MVEKLIRDFLYAVKEEIGVGIISYVGIKFLIAMGETTGNTTLANQLVQSILLVVSIGVPVGLVALVAFLKRSASRSG
jgi:hypothetical protein